MSIKIGQKDLEQVYMGNANGVRKEVKSIYGNVDGSVKLLWKKYPTAAYQVAGKPSSIFCNKWTPLCIDGADNTLAMDLTAKDNYDTTNGIEFLRYSPKKVVLPTVTHEITATGTSSADPTGVTNSDGLTLFILDTECAGDYSIHETLMSWNGKTEVVTNRGEITSSGTGLRWGCCGWSDSNGNAMFYGGTNFSGHGWSMKNTMVTVSKTLAATLTTLDEHSVDDNRRAYAQAIVRDGAVYIIGGKSYASSAGAWNADETIKIVNGVITKGPVLNSTLTAQRPTFSVLTKTNEIWAMGGVGGDNWNDDATATRTICKILESDVVTLVENGCPENMRDGSIDGNGNIQMGTDDTNNSFYTSRPVYQYKYIAATGTYSPMMGTDTTDLPLHGYRCFTDASGEILCFGESTYSSYDARLYVLPKLKNK